MPTTPAKKYDRANVVLTPRLRKAVEKHRKVTQESFCSLVRRLLTAELIPKN